MPFPFTHLLSVAMIGLTVRALVRGWRARSHLWREPLTSTQLQLLVEIALFVLVPLGVLLHELGHMVAVWLFGGRVTGFGYLLFLGWVEYNGIRSETQQFWIALSGNLVSFGLGCAALALGLFRQQRPATSALLLVSGGVILATTVVFYPALDLVSDLYGDWAQMYRSPSAAPIILGFLHGTIFLLGLVLWQSQWLRWRVSRQLRLAWRLTPRERRRALYQQLAEAIEERAKKDSALTFGWDATADYPVLECRWRDQMGLRVLRIRIGERADTLEVTALAGEPLVRRVSWRVQVPETALFVPSALPFFLEHLYRVADELVISGSES